MAKIFAGNKNNIKNGKGIIVEHSGKCVAVFNKNGSFFAIDNACPHKGKSLGDGELNGDFVVCPFHNWKVNIKTGEAQNSPGKFNEKYKVEVNGQIVFVHI